MATEDPVQISPYNWAPKLKSYDEEAKKLVVNFESATKNHPLKNVDSSAKEQKKNTDDFIDPLDPLSRVVAEVSFKEKQLRTSQSNFEPWSLKRSAILAKYTTVEKLTLTSSFLVPTNKDKVIIKTATTTTITDKIKDRLEQLDQFEDSNVQEMINLSQQDYVKRIDELNNALLQAWNEDERVKSLKIVIQCAKLLADTNVIQFYPSKFVLITDILDTFGKLVYERLRTKSLYISPGSSKPQPLPEKFTADIVPASAKETCKNWFLKIASIRELLPRIYVEASILRCLSYLSDNDFEPNLNRLISMCSGIGDPIVAAYAKCYVCRVGVSICPEIKSYQNLAFNNLLTIFQQVTNPKVKRTLEEQKLNYKTYLELYCPAVDWILQCASNNCSNEYLNELLEKCKTSTTIVRGLLINAMMSSFEPKFISSMAGKFIEMIKDCSPEHFPTHLLFRNLGMCLVFSESDRQHINLNKATAKKEELKYLSEVWKIVAKFPEPENYISCAEIWIEFTLKNFTKKEVNTLLGDIIDHVTPNRQFENFYPQLQSIVSKILAHINDLSVLFSMDKFLQFLDLFQKESVKLEVCKSVAYALLRNNTETLDDVVVINSMMQICKSMHDYVNALTFEDEKKEISNLICSFINKVRLESKEKIEQHLNFCSDARASFSNLDPVIHLLIHKVNSLAVNVLGYVDYHHSKKTAAFIRACLAYSFITIPSLSNPFSKLQLYLESAQVATLNQCLSQADAFLKAAISLIPDVPKILEANNLNSIESNLTNVAAKTSAATIDKFLNEYITNLLSTLILIPDNPEQGVLYLLNGILNVIQKHYQWENIEIKVNLLINVICLLCALKQEKYIYHIPNIESNDSLYGSDAKFLKEISKLISSTLDETFEAIQSMNALQQSKVAIEIVNKLIGFGDFTNEPTVKLAVNMWNLSLKNQTPTKLHEQIISTINLNSEERTEFRILLNKFKL